MMLKLSSALLLHDDQWRGQGLPRWATCPPGGPYEDKHGESLRKNKKKGWKFE